MRRGGFTLLEMVLVLIIIAVIGSTVARFFGVSTEAVFDAREATETQNRVGMTLDRLTREIRNARSIRECTEDRLSVNGGDRVFERAGGRIRLNGEAMAGTPEDPIRSFRCDETGIDDLYALEMETERGYEALIYAYWR
ncbi:type II secretion system protein J [Thioalkalivibrio sp. ALE23]|uniref:PulJ/GspJ family protein n=1 Tax=Thioalkalivibrio sp. ALE23 TaxID=1265495 RepID=UPI0003A931C8|nr:type II secretion system protein [Thioalkalivibrio sp. ALE23]